MYNEVLGIINVDKESNHPNISIALKRLGELKDKIGDFRAAKKHLLEARDLIMGFTPIDHDSISEIDESLSKLQASL